jgi:hypothetical protein
MSYDVSAHYAAQNTAENQLERPLKPIIGIYHGRKQLLIRFIHISDLLRYYFVELGCMLYTSLARGVTHPRSVGIYERAGADKRFKKKRSRSR